MMRRFPSRGGNTAPHSDDMMSERKCDIGRITSQQNRGENWRLTSSRGNRGGKRSSIVSQQNRGGNWKSTTPNSMGFTFLENLMKNDTEKMILILMNERQGFVNLLEKDLTADMTVLIVKILKRVCSSPFSTSKCVILQSSFNEKFVQKLITFTALLPTSQRRSSEYFWTNPNEFWSNLLTICDDLLQTTPTFANKIVAPLLNALKIYIPTVEQVCQVMVSDDLKTTLQKMLDIVQIAVKENEERHNSKEKAPDEASSAPPDDFRQISVYPTSQEIVEGRGFLRKNVVKGPYESVDHYLDVQFRLLREDFVGPLRDGIANYRSPTHTDQLENVKIHKGVRFLNAETINEFYCLKIQFGSKKFHNIENSRRFMFGSLLCFSKDNFDSIFFGKVAERKSDDLKKGQVTVAFDKKPDVDFKVSYLMVECNIYFEPYFHVLSVMQSMTEENFPMERYIIRVNPSVQPPEYLLGPDCEYQIEGRCFHPLEDWPNEQFYNFNDSQLKAFKAAITQEISVIQGPPGTGKTYLGLKVAETLLENWEHWYDKTPMLVICYTNHALDQFLEGLIPFTRHIIRVGGQSKNKALDSYNLRNRHVRDGEVLMKRHEVQRLLSSMKYIGENLQEIEKYSSILMFNIFREEIPNFGNTWFAKARRDDMLHWLLEGAEIESNFRTFKDNLTALREQEELFRVGMGDENDPDEPSDFNAHLISKLDTIFDEVQTTRFRNDLISLSAIRERLRALGNILNGLHQVTNPSLQQLIQEEETQIMVMDLQRHFDYLQQHLHYGRTLGDAVEQPRRINLTDPYKMDFEDRWNLYFYWLKLYKTREADVLRMTMQDFPEVYKEYEDMREIEDVRVMKEARVVGMTTTSAARLRASLQTLKNSIVIVEEAAEVLEAHIVTSITKHCKHLILIGDHKQLKPNTANFAVNKKYQLGISLFERMLINDIHCHTLNVQHRMRPEISSLISPAIYDFLEDHPSVRLRPRITGIDKSVFFIDHEHPEEECEGSSKVNQHEVTFFIFLARHLVLNGYDASKITVVAAYLGQFFAFQKAKKGHSDLLMDLKIVVLDNFQGEESDIILLSLVRNNKENKIGFLKIENRVCVALSRARNGMYIMGNMQQLCRNNKLWGQVKDTLEQQNALGAELHLRCQIHQDVVTAVKTQEDFYSVSEGGCNKLCGAELRCGHKCTSVCHVLDKTHVSYKCKTQCNKMLCKDESHTCRRMCFEECGPCTYLVERSLSCGHLVKIPCHVNPITYNCTVEIETVLPCGHAANKPCHCNPETFRCEHMCDIQVQPCGHSCEMLCHFRRDPDHLNYKCKKACAKFRKGCTTEEDDHRCKKLCHEECDPCMSTVRKKRTVCLHVYDVPCSSDVDELICVKPCGKQLPCGHTCKNKCNEPCGNCQMKVSKMAPICGHEVKVKCCEPPRRELCTKQCPLLLPCGHPCTTQCNQPCTTTCKVVVDFSGIKADCGHTVTRTECHMATSAVDPKLLLHYCKALCTTILKCGHPCSGSCGECAQGRVHKRCAEKCGQLLVCDHPCDVPCREACRPCGKPCPYRCAHSRCRKKCGELCTPCREDCFRSCRHQRCTRTCGELCNTPPCTEPCAKRLRCGHPCVGFCGDPCPPKCLICPNDREELLEVFFGTESVDARYVYLNDCRHVVEHSGMEEWLKSGGSQVCFKVCPKCKTAIKTTQRYSDYIKIAIQEVAKVKIKANGSLGEIKTTEREVAAMVHNLQINAMLIRYCKQLGVLLQNIQDRIKVTKKGKRQHINIHEVNAFKSKLQILEHVVSICSNEKVGSLDPSDIFFPQLNFIVECLSRDKDSITNQEIDDICSETRRLCRIVDYSCLQKAQRFNHYVNYNDSAKALISITEEHLFACREFTTESNNLLKDCLNQLNEVMRTGLAISEDEKKDILKAMKLTKGHWFKCPNGHVYAIGECGGAMEESVCNECGANIGGTRHTLLEDNAVATEMDGATQGAWSMRADMRNYYWGN